MTLQSVLIVEDEVDIADLISFNLERNGYSPLVAHDGQAGIDMAFEHLPQMIILDIMMPVKDGHAVLKELRNDSRTSDTPVLMLTAKSQEDDRILGLENGADDYLTKPFSPKELVLRTKAILKRSSVSASSSDSFECPPFRFNKSTLQFFADDELIDLTSTEFKLMLFLCERVNKPQERNALLTKVWGYHEAVNSRTLDTHMKRLRQKLGDHANHLETVRGIGYQISSLASSHSDSQ